MGLPCSHFTSFPGDSAKLTTVVATPGQGPDRPQEVSYSDIKVIGNGSFGVVYQARLADSGELVAIKKVLQDKRFKVSRKGSLSVCDSLFGILQLIFIFSPLDPRTGSCRSCGSWITATLFDCGISSTQAGRR